MNAIKKYKDCKRIIFYEIDKQHARLLVQLHYDGLKQGEFFRAILEGYISGDQNLFDFVQNYKLKKGNTKTHIRRINKEKEKSVELEKRFGLNEDEIEDIFDILEQEYLEI